jgi:hypothetical protein
MDSEKWQPLFFSFDWNSEFTFKSTALIKEV